MLRGGQRFRVNVPRWGFVLPWGILATALQKPMITGVRPAVGILATALRLAALAAAALQESMLVASGKSECCSLGFVLL